MVVDASPLENNATSINVARFLKVLIIDTAWMGDVVFTTALVSAVRRHWPDCKLHVLVSPRGTPLLEYHPAISRLWVFDKRGIRGKTGGFVRICRELRSELFDLVLNAHPSFRSRLMTFLTNARMRIGYEGFASRLMLTHSVSGDLALVPNHAIRRLNLLQPMGVIDTNTTLWVNVSDESRHQVSTLLPDDGNGGPFLGLVVGSAWATKRWSVAGFIEIGKKWESVYTGRSLVIGGMKEESSVRIIAESIGNSATSCLDYPIQTVAALLERCDVVLGNDTGVAFLSIAVRHPATIVLYGSTQVNYSFHPPHAAIRAGVPCCLSKFGHGARKCKWSDRPWCMSQISIEAVWNAIDGAMKQPKS